MDVSMYICSNFGPIGNIHVYGHVVYYGQRRCQVTGEEIKAWRRDHGLTQENLAREVGVSWSTIAKWEGGQRSPNKFTLPLLERAIQRIEKRQGKVEAAA